MKRKTLGVIGGVGPLSTAYFMEVLIRMTDAAVDQEHIDMIVLNHTEIPDRTDYILDHSKPNPAPMMREDTVKLERLGVDVIVTPCNTAHYFYDELAGSVQVPFLNMITATAEELAGMGVHRAGILATNGTVQSGLFQEALQNCGIEPIVPSAENQQFVMDIIYDNVKAGTPLDVEKFKSVTGEMKLHGCERVILGCTELSVLRRDYSLGDWYVDSLEVLAARAIEACGRRVKRI